MKKLNLQPLVSEELGTEVFLLDGERSEARNYAAKKLTAVFSCSSIRTWC